VGLRPTEASDQIRLVLLYLTTSCLLNMGRTYWGKLLTKAADLDFAEKT